MVWTVNAGWPSIDGRLIVAKLPLIPPPAVSAANCSAAPGPKPLIKVASRVPARVAVPETLS